MSDLAIQVNEPNRRLDAIDRKILMVLQDDASLSVAEIGDKVGLSSTPCWKRIQRLEADGVIQRRVALVDQNKIGLGITVFVSVESSDHSEAWLTKFAQGKKTTPGQIALAWLLAQKAWIVPIPGTTKRHRLEENVGAAAIELSAADLQEIDRAAEQIEVQGARYPERLQRLVGR